MKTFLYITIRLLSLRTKEKLYEIYLPMKFSFPLFTSSPSSIRETISSRKYRERLFLK